ncbi:MAG: PQQ-dependent sugar dehydrogenase [Sulfitobacter sp.]
MPPALAQTADKVKIAPMISGLDAPWALAHLPSGAVLVTERDGRLLHWQDGKSFEVQGVPIIDANGQGGLLDITLPRDFAQSRQVFLTYAKPQARGNGTALAVARLSQDGRQLIDLQDLFEMTPGSSGGRHFGSRVVEAVDGTLFVTIGDRGERDTAQNLSRHNGSIVRINRDGSVPADNPFVKHGNARPEIWSFGHRNPQGAGLDQNGRLWTSEHGARGGDEVNIITKGANYGWPLISYGRHYSGAKIGLGTANEGMQQPAHYWDPSIAPSGLLVYSGAMFPGWQGDILIGSLKFDYIARLRVTGETATEIAQIKSPETSRVRDIVQAPDGSIWFISVGNGTVYRMTPD